MTRDGYKEMRAEYPYALAWFAWEAALGWIVVVHFGVKLLASFWFWVLAIPGALAWAFVAGLANLMLKAAAARALGLDPSVLTVGRETYLPHQHARVVTGRVIGTVVSTATAVGSWYAAGLAFGLAFFGLPGR